MAKSTKITPEIKAFIIKKKKEWPSLSCRGLASLIKEQFNVAAAKSSINVLFKIEGLSLPIGRRDARKLKPSSKTEVKPALLIEPGVPPAPFLASTSVKLEDNGLSLILKSVDYLVGGSYYIVEAIKKRLSWGKNSFLPEIEDLIFQSLFGPNQEKGIQAYLNEPQALAKMASDIERIISTVPQEVRGVKVNLLDGGVFYLDGQMHTVWPTPYLPYSFSTTLYNIKGYVNGHLCDDKPFVLLMAPGYGRPSEEFFSFLVSLESSERKIEKITLYGNQFENLDIISFIQPKRRFFVFGLWPWQWTEYFQTIKAGEFKRFYSQSLQRELYIAETEVMLSQSVTKQEIMLKGTALKTNPADKTDIVILSNLPSETASPEKLADIYFDSWPNLQETYQDLKQKVEFFTYIGSVQSHFSLDKLKLGQAYADKTALSSAHSDRGDVIARSNTGAPKQSNLKALFDDYIKILELYFRWYFLPVGFGDADFPAIKECLFNLKVVLEAGEERSSAMFQAPESFRFLKELEYICRRINERRIMLKGKRLLCAVKKAVS